MPTSTCSGGPTTSRRDCHQGQFRRSGDPYVTHPVTVATILAGLGADDQTLCAAILHDTVEDTPYTLSALSPAPSGTAWTAVQVAHL